MCRKTTREDHERQEVVQREEAIERRVVDGEATPQPGHDALAEERYGREQVGDDHGTPEAHLAPRQHIAHERGRHHQEKDDHAQHPQELARRLVGSVIEPAEHVDVDDDEEHRRAVGMRIAHQPTEIHVAHDVLDAAERVVDMRDVMHRQKQAGQDLQHQHDPGQRAEVPPVVQVLRCRVVDELGARPGEERQAIIDPPGDTVLENGLLGFCGHHRS